MMNFVLGFVVLLVLVITSGKLGSTTVAQFTDNAQSCADGLREGDTDPESRRPGLPHHR